VRATASFLIFEQYVTKALELAHEVLVAGYLGG
jgi:hypothetical protein